MVEPIAARNGWSGPTPRGTQVVPGRTTGVLFACEGLTVGFTRCRPANAEAGPAYQLDRNVVTFTRSGVFAIHRGSHKSTITPNEVLIHGVGDVFSTSHPGGRGDETTWFSLSEAAAREAIRPHDPGLADRADFHFPAIQIHCDASMALLHHTIAADTQDPANDRGEIAERCYELVAMVIRSAFHQRPGAKNGERQSTTKAHRETTELVKEILALRFRERITVADIARSVHVSPFHLCRLFRRHAGVPIHDYLTQLRVRHVLSRLGDPSARLAALAEESGFFSHSHLCDAIRRVHGTTPSVLRDRIRGGPDAVPTSTHGAASLRDMGGRVLSLI